MKTFQIEDAKMRLFKSKEHYLNFKQAWKDFHNNELLVEWKNLEITPWDIRHGSKTYDPVYERTKYSVLSSAHYMFYNLARGYDIQRGYAPLTNKGRLTANLYACDYDPNPWQNCIGAAKEIIRYTRSLEYLNNDSSWQRNNARETLAKFMLPFGDTVTYEILYEIGSKLYTHLTGDPFPEIIIEEAKEFEEPKPAPKPIKRKSIAEKILAWRKG